MVRHKAFSPSQIDASSKGHLFSSLCVLGNQAQLHNACNTEQILLWRRRLFSERRMLGLFAGLQCSGDKADSWVPDAWLGAPPGSPVGSASSLQLLPEFHVSAVAPDCSFNRSGACLRDSFIKHEAARLQPMLNLDEQPQLMLSHTSSHLSSSTTQQRLLRLGSDGMDDLTASAELSSADWLALAQDCGLPLMPLPSQATTSPAIEAAIVQEQLLPPLRMQAACSWPNSAQSMSSISSDTVIAQSPASPASLLPSRSMQSPSSAATQQPLSSYHHIRKETSQPVAAGATSSRDCTVLKPASEGNAIKGARKRGRPRVYDTATPVLAAGGSLSHPWLSACGVVYNNNDCTNRSTQGPNVAPPMPLQHLALHVQQSHLMMPATFRDLSLSMHPLVMHPEKLHRSVVEPSPNICMQPRKRPWPRGKHLHLFVTGIYSLLCQSVSGSKWRLAVGNSGGGDCLIKSATR